MEALLGPLALDDIANGALQQRCFDLLPGQVVHRSGVHRFEACFVLALPGQHYYRRSIYLTDYFMQEFQPATLAEMIVNKACIVSVALDRP